MELESLSDVLVGMVWTGFPYDGSGVRDNGGDGGGVGSMNPGEKVREGSFDCFFEAGGPSSTMGSGMVAYRGRPWDGGDERCTALIACPCGDHWCSHWGVGCILPGKCPADRRQR